MKDLPSNTQGLGTLIITGGSGRIGSSFIDRVGDTYTEIGFDHEGPPHPPLETEYVIACDLGSDESVRAALDEVRRLDLPQVTALLIGEPEMLSYDVLQRAISRHLYGKEWKTSSIPKPLAKCGARIQTVLPIGDPFIKPWMIDLSDDH